MAETHETSDKKIRKRIFNNDSDLEEGELSDTEELDVPKFSDGYANDRAMLNNLREVNRERELYERGLRRKSLYDKWSIGRRLAKKVAAETSGARDNQDHKLPNLTEQSDNKRKGAMQRLLAMRKSKQVKYEPSMCRESASDSDEEPDSSQRSKKIKLKTRDIYSDDSSLSDADNRTNSKILASGIKDNRLLRITKLEELRDACLTRRQLESFLDKPVFEKTVVGCFVRINIGREMPLYRLAHVSSITKLPQEYQFGSKRTAIALQLEHGAEQNVTKMHVISNSPVTDTEFNTWVLACRRSHIPLPYNGNVLQKQQHIEQAANYSFTEDDVERMLQDKRRSGNLPVRPAFLKVNLIMQRDAAMFKKDTSNVAEVEQEIMEIDERTRRLELKRIEFNRTKLLNLVRNMLKPAQRKELTNAKPKLELTDLEMAPYMRRNSKIIDQLLAENEKAKAAGKAKEQADDVFFDEQILEAVAPTFDTYKLHDYDIQIDLTGLPDISTVFKDNMWRKQHNNK